MLELLAYHLHVHTCFSSQQMWSCVPSDKVNDLSAILQWFVSAGSEQRKRKEFKKLTTSQKYSVTNFPLNLFSQYFDPQHTDTCSKVMALGVRGQARHRAQPGTQPAHPVSVPFLSILFSLFLYSFLLSLICRFHELRAQYLLVEKPVATQFTSLDHRRMGVT